MFGLVLIRIKILISCENTDFNDIVYLDNCLMGGANSGFILQRKYNTMHPRKVVLFLLFWVKQQRPCLVPILRRTVKSEQFLLCLLLAVLPDSRGIIHPYLLSSKASCKQQVVESMNWGTSPIGIPLNSQSILESNHHISRAETACCLCKCGFQTSYTRRKTFQNNSRFLSGSIES